MIGRRELITYLRQLVQMERQIKMSYFFLSDQIGDPDIRKLFQEMEAEKQRHEDDLEKIATRLETAGND